MPLVNFKAVWLLNPQINENISKKTKKKTFQGAVDNPKE